METVKEIIDSYIAIIPEGASDIQVRETKMAFIAGMYAYRNMSVHAASYKSIEVAETVMIKMEKQLVEAKNEITKEAEDV